MPRRAKTGPDPTALAFGTALRAARDRRKETLEDVAGRVPRMDPRYLGEMELGWHAPTIITAKRLADALETSLSELVSDL
jgi:transcriptional regulator with XRE-family HTH domain